MGGQAGSSKSVSWARSDSGTRTDRTELRNPATATDRLTTHSAIVRHLTRRCTSPWRKSQRSTFGSMGRSRRRSFVRRRRSSTRSRIARGHPRVGLRRLEHEQATGHFSDLLLRPVKMRPRSAAPRGRRARALRGAQSGRHRPPSNTRALLREVAEKYKEHDAWFGIEQEYTFFEGNRPLGWPDQRIPRAAGRLLLRRRRGRSVRPRRRRSARRSLHARRDPHRRHERRGHAGAVGVPGRRRSVRSTSPTSCGWRAGFSTASAKSSASAPRSIRSRSKATGTAPARTRTSRRRRCAPTAA